jgi:hypothetical protein
MPRKLPGDEGGQPENLQLTLNYQRRKVDGCNCIYYILNHCLSDFSDKKAGCLFLPEKENRLLLPPY